MPDSATLQAPAAAAAHPIMLPHQGTALETLLSGASAEELRTMVRELSDELAWALHSFAPAHRLTELPTPDADDQANETVVLYKAAPFTDDMHPTQVTRDQAHAFAEAHRQDLVPFAEGFTLACWVHGSFHANAALDHT